MGLDAGTPGLRHFGDLEGLAPRRCGGAGRFRVRGVDRIGDFAVDHRSNGIAAVFVPAIVHGPQDGESAPAVRRDPREVFPQRRSECAQIPAVGHAGAAGEARDQFLGGPGAASGANTGVHRSFPDAPANGQRRRPRFRSGGRRGRFPQRRGSAGVRVRHVFGRSAAGLSGDAGGPIRRAGHDFRRSHLGVRATDFRGRDVHGHQHGDFHQSPPPHPRPWVTVHARHLQVPGGGHLFRGRLPVVLRLPRPRPVGDHRLLGLQQPVDDEPERHHHHHPRTAPSPDAGVPRAARPDTGCPTG